VLSTGELDVLLHRIHWYLGQTQQVARELADATGLAVEDNRATLVELERVLTSQRHAVAELRRVLARRLLDERARMGRPA
jgi:hypothetical protein